MPNRRNLSLKQYKIDDDHYNELYYFCKRYQSREEEINSLYGLTAIAMDGMPKGNKVGSQTEAKAIRIDKLRKENELIEQTAIETDSCIYQYILKNITQGIPYEHMDVPCGRRQFYQYRRLFFKLLSDKR